MSGLEGMETAVNSYMDRDLVLEAIDAADRVVPEYRNGKKAYSCTSHTAKRWQAAYEGACAAYGVDP